MEAKLNPYKNPREPTVTVIKEGTAMDSGGRNFSNSYKQSMLEACSPSSKLSLSPVKKSTGIDMSPSKFARQSTVISKKNRAHMGT